MAGFNLCTLSVLAVLCLPLLYECVPVVGRHSRDTQGLLQPESGISLSDTNDPGTGQSEPSLQQDSVQHDQSDEVSNIDQTAQDSSNGFDGGYDLPIHESESDRQHQEIDADPNLALDINGQDERQDSESYHSAGGTGGQTHNRRDLDYVDTERRGNRTEAHSFLLDGDGDGDATSVRNAAGSVKSNDTQHTEQAHEQHPFLLSSEFARLHAYETAANESHNETSAASVNGGSGSSGEIVDHIHNTNSETVKTDTGTGGEHGHTEPVSGGETIHTDHISSSGSELNGTNEETGDSGGHGTSIQNGEHSETEHGVGANIGNHVVNENHENPGVDSGVDVPIDKGTGHQGNIEESEEHEHGLPHHTNIPVITSGTTGFFPITEPNGSTAKLVILPTPAQPEQIERESSEIVQQPVMSSIGYVGEGHSIVDEGHQGEGQSHEGLGSGESEGHSGEGHESSGEGHPDSQEGQDHSGDTSNEGSENEQDGSKQGKEGDKENTDKLSARSTTHATESFTSVIYGIPNPSKTLTNTEPSIQNIISQTPTLSSIQTLPSSSVVPNNAGSVEEVHSDKHEQLYASFTASSISTVSSVDFTPGLSATISYSYNNNNDNYYDLQSDLLSSTLSSPSPTQSTTVLSSTSLVHVYPSEHLPSERNTQVLVNSPSILPSSSFVSPFTSSVFQLPTASVEVIISHQNTTSTASETTEHFVTRDTDTASSRFPEVPVPTENHVSVSSIPTTSTAAAVSRNHLTTSSIKGSNSTTTNPITATSHTDLVIPETSLRPVVTLPAVIIHTLRTVGSSTQTTTGRGQSTTTEISHVTGPQTTVVINETSPQTHAVIDNRPILVPVPMTTKRKDETVNNSTQHTTLRTTKKATNTKGSEKPESNYTTTTETSSSQASTSSMRTRTSAMTTRAFVTMASLATIRTSPMPELTTQSPVFIRISIRMSWIQFCGHISHFKDELRNIIRSEKQVYVKTEQFKITNIPTEYCSPANPLMSLNEETINEISVEMFITDNEGKLDVTLTIDAFKAIIPGFQDRSSIFKDKIVDVHLNDMRQAAQHPVDHSTSTKEMPTGVTMVIVIAAVGGCCCVVIIILQVIIHRRVAAKKMRPFTGHRASLQSMDHVALGVIPKSRPNSGYWNPALDNHEEVTEPKEHSHLVNFASLANFCMDPTGIHEEFQTIPFDNPGLTSVPVGEEDKNRFANVLPHKHTRVRLKKREDGLSDYINANYVTGYKRDKHAYIATQSPLVNTVDDFWRMVWEQQSRAILMLNPVLPTGKPRQSTCYWPDNEVSDSMREYGDFTVTLKKRDVQQDYVDCTLEIMDIERNLKREVHHFWLTCWPDMTMPEPLSFVKFVLDTRPLYEDSGAPVVVHCGPGTGRTGTLIGVDICMRMFENKRCADVKNCIHKMRSERAGSVQKKEQYALVYQALNEYAVILSSPSVSTRSSVITLHAML